MDKLSRRERNRISARKARAKKMARIQGLAQENAQLKEKIRELLEIVAALKKELGRE